MIKRRILTILAMALIIPFVFMLSACGGSGDNNQNQEPLPEGYYRITALQTTGGTVTASKSSAQEGEEITLSYRTNSGYLFVSITVKDENNQDVELNDNKFTMPASDVIVSATFERASGQKYFVEINFDVYGEIELVSPSMEQFAQSQGKISAGTRVVLRYEMFEDWQGYEFKSWNIVDTNGNSVTVTNNSFIMPNSNVTVSAVVGEKTYTVSVDEETARMLNVIITNDDDNNSVIESGSLVKYATRISLSYEFKEEGYTFGGWKDQNGQGLYNPIYVNKNLVISANINAEEYSLTVDNRWTDAVLGEGQALNARGGKSLYLTKANGQRINPSNEYNSNNKGYTGEEITIHCETINQNYSVDYYILTYYLDGELHNEHITTNKFNMLPESVKVSVQLRLVENTYSVNYVLDGGEMPSSAPTTFKSTDATLQIPNPTKEGYKFDGWEEEDKYSRIGGENSITFYPSQITSNLTLTAVWIKAGTITYDYSHYTSYDFDGFNGKYVDDNNPTTFVAEQYIELNAPIYPYGEFKGWYTSPTFEEESKIETIHVEDENDLVDLTLYAKMEFKNFHINFVKIGISTDGTRKTLATSAYLDWFNLAEDPRDLTRDMYNEKTYTIGYTFAGFFTDADLTTPITEVSNELDHSITIYAKETLDTYTITYYANDVNTRTYGPITYLTFSYTIETESIFIPTYSNFDNAYGHWILRGWRLNNKDTGEYYECFTRIYPSANPEKFHGNLVFHAYYELQ